MIIKRVISAILTLGILVSSAGVSAQQTVWEETKNTVFSSDETVMEDYDASTGYVLSDENGLSYPNQGDFYTVITKEQTTGSDFKLDISMIRNYNSLLIFFNYIDENNYSLIKINDNAELLKISEGVESVIESQVMSQGIWGAANVSLTRLEGKLQLSVNGSIELDNIEDSYPADGKYGAGFQWTFGDIKSIKLSHVSENQGEEDEDEMIENLNTEPEIDYDFSPENAEENWIVVNPTNNSYEFQGDKFNSPEVSTIALVTKNKFRAPVRLAVDIWHEFNQNRAVFAFKDENNYCYIEYTGTGISVVKVVGGAETVIGTYSTPIGEPGWKELETVVTIKKGSKIDIDTVYSGATFRIVSDLEDTAFKTAGGFGASFKYTPGYISRVHAKGFLSAVSSNTDEEGFGISSNAQFEFNHSVNADTINEETVIVTDAKGNNIPYTFTVDDKILELDFDFPLDYKSEYKITLKKDIQILDKDWGMLEDEVYTIKTQKAPFDIIGLYAKKGDDTVYHEDMTTLNGSVENSLSSCKGENVDVFMNVQNNAQSLEAMLVVALENKDGKVFSLKTLNSSFAENENGYINESGELSDLEEKIATFSVPDIDEEFLIKYFVVNKADNMNSLYPYMGIGKAETGNEVPECVLGEKNTLIISGVTDTAKENAYVNISLSDTNSIYKAQTVKTGENGKYSLSFVVNDALLPKSGEYTVKVFGSEMSTIKSVPVYLAKSGDLDDAIYEINQADSSAMITKIEQYAQLLNFSAYKYSKEKNPYNVISKSELAQMMYDYEGDFTKDDINDFVLEASAVCAYNQGLEEYLYDADKNMIYKDIIDFSHAVSGEYGAYSIYENKLTETGRTNVRAEILSKSCKSADDLMKVFVQAVVVNSIKNYTSDGYGHIRNIIMANADMAGLNIDKYSSLSDTGTTDRNIYLSNIASVSDINTILNAIGTTGSNTGNTGSNSGSSGGGSSSGGSWQKYTNNQTAHDYVKDAAMEGILKGFADLNGFEWAKEAIEYLYDRGIVNGKADGVFAPADDIKREEFVKMLVLALSLKGEDYSNSFEDVKASEWYAPYINTACSLGIVQGMSDTEFGIGKNITRQDAAVMIYRALGLGEQQSSNEVLDAFGDKVNVSEYAQNAMAYMVENGIINGVTDTELAPMVNGNRAQLAVILHRVINMGGTK